MAGGGEGIVGPPGRGHGTEKPGPAGGRLEFPVPPVLPCDSWGSVQRQECMVTSKQQGLPRQPSAPCSEGAMGAPGGALPAQRHGAGPSAGLCSACVGPVGGGQQAEERQKVGVRRRCGAGGMGSADDLHLMLIRFYRNWCPWAFFKS